jgi:Skp family chaperone for outer membrane proteins
MKNNILAVSLLALAALCGAAHAAEEDVSAADPARWYTPDDTPKARYQNLTKEANAAYGEAVLECKGKRGKELKACRGTAAAAKKDDMERAKRIYNDYKASAPAS